MKLLNYQNYDENTAMQKLFEDTVTNKKIKIRKTEYADDFVIYNLKDVDLNTLKKIKEDQIFETIFSIEPMPKYRIEVDSISNDFEIDIMLPQKDKKYVVVGVLDSGIASIPHLKPWIIEERWSPYPDTNLNLSHGTMVSGVSIYGDICESEILVGNAGVKVFDAAIIPDTSRESIDEDELIGNIKEVISQKYEDIKIWNLSVSLTKEVEDNCFSDFAIALDQLQTQYNILICKSAGNCGNFLNNIPKGRLYAGADSIRSLVVGSLAHKKNVNDFSEKDNPSPFSRRGPGPAYIIKPEVSHYGGNAGKSASGSLSKTGIKTFSADGSMIETIGTSFSTPRVTSLVAGLVQELDEEFDPLLIKALIIHSANYSEKLTVPNNERTNQLGFGKPKTIKEILYNTANEATLILRDTLTKGERIDIMDFPMPKELIKDNYFTGQVTVTLVYDPILDPSQFSEYCQSNIDLKFGSYDEKEERDTSKRNILNPIGRKGAMNILNEGLYSKTKMNGKREDFALKERLLIKYGDKFYPVKKYAVDLSELTDKNKIKYLDKDKRWYLCLRGLYRDHIEKFEDEKSALELSQDFCLIITIKDPSGEINVFDSVTQSLNENNFWHSNIRVTNDIDIKVNV